MPHTLLTIDVWDTALRRRCHPDEVKLFTARALFLRFNRWLRPRYPDPLALLHLRQRCEHDIGRERLAAGADNEYHLDEVIERWTREALADPPPALLAAADAELRDIELEQEHQVTYADPGFEPFLRSLPAEQVVALSDFYIPADELRRLLRSKSPGLPLHDTLVSCDVSLNKRSGRLFSYAHQRFRIQPSQHLHVGDHAHADDRVPTALGIRAIHYVNPPEEAARAAHHERWAARHAGPAALRPRLLWDPNHSATPPGELSPDQREVFAAGVRAAPLFVGLVLRAIEEAIKHAVPTVHYFTREGAFFHRVHRALADAAPARSLLGVPLPQPSLLEVSRLSTFAASISAVTPEEFMRLWNLFSTQSMAGLLASLGIPAFVAAPLLDSHRLPPQEPVLYPWADARVRSLFADRRFVRLVERHRDARRASLLHYLATKGIHDDGRPKVLVDIGWRGTIQDNLARVLGSSPLIGIYLGMHRLLNVQPPNVVKTAYAADVGADPHRCGPVLEHVQPLEMLCNSPEGSVVGYQPGPTPGSVLAARAPDPQESASFIRCARFFQDGVVAAVPRLACPIRDFALSAQELCPLAFEALREIIADPPLSAAKTFFDLNHNETFGLGRFVEMHHTPPRSLARRAAKDPAARDELDRQASQSLWPCAYYRLHGLEPHRARYARAKLGARPQTDPHTTDPATAAEALRSIESSWAWRLLQSLKHRWPYRAIARARFGPDWDAGPPADDPVQRLTWIRNSRTFRFLQTLSPSTGVPANSHGNHAPGIADPTGPVRP